MAKTEKLPAEGTIAGPDDVAPQGTVITRQHILDYRRRVEAAHAKMGLEPPRWS